MTDNRFARRREDIVHPSLSELDGDASDEIEKDQYAEIAERDGRFSGEHNTSMSSGNIQKQDAQIASRNGDDGEPLIQTSGGANPFTGKGDLAERGGDEGLEEETGKTKNDLVEKKCTPQGSEGQAKFMDRCIHEKTPGMSPGNAADQCYAIWHSSKGTSKKSQVEEAVKKASIMRLVFKGAITIGGMFARKSR